MSNGKLIFAVILFCITGPIMIGYVWPVDSTSEIAWETGDPRDISNDAINAKLPVYVPYNDPYNNNQNVFLEGQPFYNNNPRNVTISPGPVWHFNDYRPYNSTVHILANGTYRIDDISSWADWSYVKAVTCSPYVQNVYWINTVEIDGNEIDLFIYYPQTDKLYYKLTNTAEYIPAVSNSITFHAYSTYSGTDQDLSVIEYFSDGYYVELSDGFYVPDSISDWFNGYANKGFNIIMNVPSDMENHILIRDLNGVTNKEIIVYVTSGIINMRVFSGQTLDYQGSLGDRSIYDKVLLTVDYDSASIALSGLRNMSSFIGDYSGAIRETIKADWNDPVIFHTFSIYRIGSLGALWYVADTFSAVAETDGSHDYVMDLRDYTVSGSCQLNIRNTLLHGDTLGFGINTIYRLGTISGGNLSVQGADGVITVPVNNFLIGLIGNKVYLNGQLLYEDTTINRLELYFYGDWRMSLIYYSMTETTVPGYEWLPGGFGLDENGFCIVGLIVSSLTGLAASLYGRRSGAKMFAVAFVSGVIAVVYLLILMGGL